MLTITSDSQKPSWLLLGLFLFVFTLGFLTLPAVKYGGDPIAWREEARSLLIYGRLSVDADIAQSYGERGQLFVLNPRDGRWYSKYGIFNGLLYSVPLAAEQLITGGLPSGDSSTRVLVFGVYFLFITLVIAYLLYAVTGYYTDNAQARVAYVLIAFYTTYLWNYLRSATSESAQLCAYLLCYLFLLRYKRRKKAMSERPLWEIYIAWVALGVLCQIRFAYLVFVPMFALGLVYLALRDGLPRSKWLSFAIRAVALPCTVILIAQGTVHYFKFGSPFVTGYHQWWDPDNPHTIWTVLSDFLINPQWSWFASFPPLVLALFGLTRFLSRRSDEAVFLLLTLLLVFCLVEPLPYWRGEWCYGPRYFVFLLPLLSLPALHPLEWAFARPRLPVRASFLIALLVGGAFLAFGQMQVNRLTFNFKYYVQQDLRGLESRVVDDYFNNTHFAKINWDHLQAGGHLEAMPYFADVRLGMSPEAIAKWKSEVQHLVSCSNLYWFPHINE